MIMEIAQIDVKPGMENAFETGVKNAVPLFQRAKGCTAMALQRSHEKPQRYRLFVKGTRWRTTPSTSAARPIFRNGASWSATASPHRPRSSTSPRW